ncbi:hypothetical protein F3Y22_tig00013960pilonHSYRG00088 [Hibiscus syriacus]|uniref:RNase H type-1 domain-containing protein n=1 Tax=Hibiscus syriacus TaxID=106335 RepID=A0A6A3C2A3_HIBSY|nr:hypothetical protein F3Y22_tig00013960pilonHSYRG00088 [Hibiscus syriacus]
MTKGGGWGKSSLVNWDFIAQPKIHGGLGLRKLANRNLAFLFKICYGLTLIVTGLIFLDTNIKYRRSVLPRSIHEAIQRIRDIPPPALVPSVDGCVWDSDKLGIFSVKSAYTQLSIHHWSPKDKKWTLIWKIQTLNTDGAVNPQLSISSVGGGGLFVTTMEIGLVSPSVLHSELWDIFYGLVLAWSYGYRRVQCQTDSSEAYSLLTAPNLLSSTLPLVRMICQLLSGAWSLDFKLIKRESNMIADHLAKAARNTDGLTRVFSCTFT